MTKKHKQNAARDRNYGEYAEISKLLDKIRSVGMGGISAEDVYKRQALRRLDWQQEQGFVSSLALGYNEVEIQRVMTTCLLYTSRCV